jgi:hypothetical protein
VKERRFGLGPLANCCFCAMFQYRYVNQAVSPSSFHQLQHAAQSTQPERSHGQSGFFLAARAQGAGLREGFLMSAWLHLQGSLIEFQA